MDFHDLICLLFLTISTITSLTVSSDLTEEESSTTNPLQEFQKNPCTIMKSRENRDVQFFCPSLELVDFSVEIKSGEGVQMICYVEDANLTSINTDIGPVDIFRSKNCNLVSKFRQIFKLWNIQGTTKWDITGYSNKDFVLRKSEFEGLNVSEVVIVQIQESNIIEIEFDTFYDFVNLEVISLMRNKLKVLPDLFKYSKSVRFMELPQNNLETLPEQLTAPSLINLQLFGNNLSYLSESLLSNAPKLKTLEFSRNNIDFLPEKLLNPAPNLRTLSFFGNNIAEIPPNFFKTNEHIYDLRLSGLNLSTIPENIFENFTNLTVLMLQMNALESLPENLFSKQYKLKNLVLNNNKLTHLSKTIFKDLENLQYLDLSNNQFSEWLYDNSVSLKKLKELHLAGNNLNKIESDFFYGLNELTFLDLSNNNISYIAVSTFNSLKLKNLDLSRNNLRDADELSFVDGINHIDTIDLSHNLFEKLPYNIGLKTRTLDMSYNNIRGILVFDLMNMGKVLLNDNKIETINFDLLDQFFIGTEDLTKRSNVVVYVDNNPIQCGCSAYSLIEFFDKTYKNDEIYKLLSLKGQLTCQGPPQLAGKKVSELISELFACNYKDIFSCPKECSCTMFPKYRSFNVDCRGLNLNVPPKLSNFSPVYFGRAFSVTKLKVDLTNNSISNFTERDTSYFNVSQLYLSNNKLDLVSWLPPRLEVLELNDNKLQNLNYKAFSVLNKTDTLKRLTLHDNNWNCNCQLLNLTKLVQKWKRFQIPHENENNILCSNGEKVIQMTEGNLCVLENQAALLAIGICFFLFLIMIGVALILYYKYEYHVKVWLYSKPLFMRFVTEDDLDKDKIYDAFLSYSHKDEDFVVQELISVLEGGPEPYKLCIHERDWIVGEFINKQIVNSVENSRRTIIVLSQHFLQSEWATLEFRTAHMQAIREGRHRLVVILYGDIDPSAIEDEDLQAYLSTNTYVKWGDPWFWKKLRYVLPHKKNGYSNNNNRDTRSRKTKNSRKMENILVTIDKMDLINSPATPNLGTPPAVSLDPLLIKTSALEFKSAPNSETPPAEGELITTVNY